MGLFSFLFGKTDDTALQTAIKEGAFLVDVRTPQEFKNNKVKGSVNIPLGSISQQIAKFKNKKNIIVFCQSGMRCGQAKRILEQNGIDHVLNGKTWMKMNKIINQ